MSPGVYANYKLKCKELGIRPSTKESLERNEEVVDVVHEGKGRYILVTRAYDMGYKEAMRQIAS